MLLVHTLSSSTLATAYMTTTNTKHMYLVGLALQTKLTEITANALIVFRERCVTDGHSCCWIDTPTESIVALLWAELPGDSVTADVRGVHL